MRKKNQSNDFYLRLFDCFSVYFVFQSKFVHLYVILKFFHELYFFFSCLCYCFII